MFRGTLGWRDVTTRDSKNGAAMTCPEQKVGRERQRITEPKVARWRPTQLIAGVIVIPGRKMRLLCLYLNEGPQSWLVRGTQGLCMCCSRPSHAWGPRDNEQGATWASGRGQPGTAACPLRPRRPLPVPGREG